jgi:antitoxin HigA-1
MMHDPPHPGEVLKEWLTTVTITEAARRLRITRAALSRVLNGSAGVSAEMDLRLSKALGTTPGSWYAMQCDYDLWQAGRHFEVDVEPIVAPSKAAACKGKLRSD